MDKPKRAHYQASDGRAYQLPVAVTAAGEQIPAPITNSRPMDASRVAAAGFPIISRNQATMQQNQLGGALPFAVVQDENAYGRRGVARMERPARNAPVREQWTITISNGEATTEEFLIGDNTGLLAAALGIPAPKAGVTITGTFGANTYTFFSAISGKNPVDLHRLHLVGNTTAGAASTAFFTSGLLKVMDASIANNTNEANIIPLADLVLPDTYQTNIRVDNNFRFIMDGLSALYLQIPAAEAVTLTFREVSAVNRVYAMEKVSPSFYGANV